MPEYQLEIKQVVDYPRCRIYRQFIQTLIAARSIRTNNGGSGLFYFTVLCPYASFRTSYRRLDGISCTIYPGKWICSLGEMAQWFRCRADMLHWSCSKLQLQLKTTVKGCRRHLFFALLRIMKQHPKRFGCCFCFQPSNQ